MSTEQEIGVSSWLALASSVILDEPGSPWYLSFNGFCTALRSMLLLAYPLRGPNVRYALRRDKTGACTVRSVACAAHVLLFST